MPLLTLVVAACAEALSQQQHQRQQLLRGDLYLGIDCGTQGTKAVVYDATSREVVGVGSESYGLIQERRGQAEQEPRVWEAAMVSACRGALEAASARSVRGIGVSGQQHGLVALDEAYEVLRPAKLWCDTESSGEAEELASALGWGIVASFTATKLLWMKRNEPESWSRLYRVALPHDWLNLRLTGRLVMECGDASGTGLLDVEAREWDEKAAALVDAALVEKLPPLVAPTDAAGYLLPEMAARLGLAPGTPVSAGSGDNMMSALGCGVTVQGRAAASLGTSGTLFARSPEAARDPSGVVCPFLDAAGGGLPLLCTLNCASVPEEVRKGYGLDRDGIAALAAAEEVGCDGLSFLPYLVGERTPNWPWASGALVGLRPGHLARPGLLYRAALEGATFSLKKGIEALADVGVPRCDQLRLVGGGSKSPLWRKIVADACQVQVAVPAQPESAALGAALQAAALVAGAADVAEWIRENHDAPVVATVDPDPALKSAYDQAFELHNQRGADLFGRPPLL
ncbi:hypothetical protein CTAYLR_004905 [Chrysophaeum taylorii]|uniref:glycerol kinase n=1 Tax=Chrysophaeum taylorii TaxID=2483200 RepID=A0AAD7UNK6_9STRA|nr:hypothetical protein CTAYLR_004905 [Chrysophaeum taylorii]